MMFNVTSSNAIALAMIILNEVQGSPQVRKQLPLEVSDAGPNWLVKGRIDPVHHDGQPAPRRHAAVERQEAAREGDMLFAPDGDRIVIVAIGDRPADRQEQKLRHGKRHAAQLAGIVDAREMIEQQSRARRFLEIRR